jgi:hypothetical protein
VTVTALDAALGQKIDGQVWSNAEPVGQTGTPFQATFREAWRRIRQVDPRTHEVTWHWIGPLMPRITVAANGYDRTDVAVVFTGAHRPPDDDA